MANRDAGKSLVFGIKCQLRRVLGAEDAQVGPSSRAPDVM